MDETNQAPSADVTQAVADSNASTSASLSTAVAADSAQSSLSTPLSTSALVDPAPEQVEAAKIPQETLLARLHADLEALERKIELGIHVFAHEVAAIRDQVKALI
ncbi:hypothetical protein [Burkholderia glumae]|uniref:hypothetical protein n=1 Tax=Burkholderia glumae TaxID=337 RepID=UPI0003F80B8F|nr:hypothetical protein [Burkholderia glumae]QHP90594.1 hypothetical protein EXE55_06400 [Burkholderia glumae]QJP72434.1 hypothetical protein HJC54_20130 [Burkholderia glumae]QKM52170.1 hypothetical protein CG017_00159 [Burkholderia glumae]